MHVGASYLKRTFYIYMYMKPYGRAVVESTVGGGPARTCAKAKAF